MSDVEFWEYSILPRDENTPFLLSIGERIKKGTVRPFISTTSFHNIIPIPFSTIVGALKTCIDADEIYAAGFFFNHVEKEEIEHSASNWALGTGKLPLSTEVLVNPRGKVFILAKDHSLDIRKNLPENSLDITLGAMKSKGFGRCKLERSHNLLINPKKISGILKTRIPIDYKGKFGINEIKKPVYGYLYRPISLDKAECVKSLFEGSIVSGYHFLLKEL